MNNLDIPTAYQRGKTVSQPRSGKSNAGRFGGYLAPKAFDAEEDALRKEFADLDLTDKEQADLAEAFRYRGPGSTNSQRIASRDLFQRVRRSLQNAVAATVEHEAARDDQRLTGEQFDRDEEIRLQRLVVALCRPATNEEVDRLNAEVETLGLTRRARRAAAMFGVRAGEKATGQAKSDAFRIHSRDGLGALADSGKLTSRQADAGRAYRKRYEAAFKGLRSTLGTEVTSVSPVIDEMVASRTRLARSEVERIHVEQAVLRQMRAKPMALTLLRRVAGEGFSMKSLSAGGKQFTRNVETLAEALDIAASILPQDA